MVMKSLQLCSANLLGVCRALGPRLVLNHPWLALLALLHRRIDRVINCRLRSYGLRFGSCLSSVVSDVSGSTELLKKLPFGAIIRYGLHDIRRMGCH